MLEAKHMEGRIHANRVNSCRMVTLAFKIIIQMKLLITVMFVVYHVKENYYDVFIRTAEV